MTSIKVDVDNFVRAETNRMLRDLTRLARGVNSWHHNLEPTAVDAQTVIRMNRDTLYSMVVADLSGGATLTVPEHGDRYTSVMVVNQDHYINRIIHEPGEHRLTVDEFDTQYALVAARVLADPEDPADVAAANEIQRAFRFEAANSQPFEMPDYDKESFDAVRAAVLNLGQHTGGGGHSFGRQEDVDPVRHLCGTATGWGGLPEHEAVYDFLSGGSADEPQRVVVRDVPVDAFWSFSVYNKDGFFEANATNSYSVNSLTAVREADGSVVVHLGGDDDRPNVIPITDGWNAVARMYRPRQEVIDGTWKFPRPEPA
jgi:hypothetical protein